MMKLIPSLLLILLLFPQILAEASLSHNAETHVVALQHKLSHKKINCRHACARRCRASSRKKVCHRACRTCCRRCHCVPPGTYGNTESCPCYASLRTHGNQLKCP